MLYYNSELVFQLESGCAVLGKNMPSVAGNLKWSQELRNRILCNRSNLCQLAHMYGTNQICLQIIYMSYMYITLRSLPPFQASGLC